MKGQGEFRMVGPKGGIRLKLVGGFLSVINRKSLGIQSVTSSKCCGCFLVEVVAVSNIVSSIIIIIFSSSSVQE